MEPGGVLYPIIGGAGALLVSAAVLDSPVAVALVTVAGVILGFSLIAEW